MKISEIMSLILKTYVAVYILRGLYLILTILAVVALSQLFVRKSPAACDSGTTGRFFRYENIMYDTDGNDIQVVNLVRNKIEILSDRVESRDLRHCTANMEFEDYYTKKKYALRNVKYKIEHINHDDGTGNFYILNNPRFEKIK